MSSDLQFVSLQIATLISYSVTDYQEKFLLELLFEDCKSIFRRQFTLQLLFILTSMLILLNIKTLAVKYLGFLINKNNSPSFSTNICKSDPCVLYTDTRITFSLSK